MELKERIKKARKEAGFKSQEKLAEFLGTTRDAIATYELGRVIPNDVFLQLMATKLSISFEWLKYGTVEMRTQERATPPLEVLDEDDRVIIEIYLALPPAERRILKKFAVQVAATQAERQDLPAELPKSIEATVYAAETQREPPAPKSSDSDKPELDPEIEAEAEKFRARLYAREKTRRILTGSTDSAAFSENKKSRP